MAEKSQKRRGVICGLASAVRVPAHTVCTAPVVNQNNVLEAYALSDMVYV